MSILCHIFVFIIYCIIIYATIKHYLIIRDKEWIIWAKEHGIDGNYPEYDYKGKYDNIYEGPYKVNTETGEEIKIDVFNG